MELLFFWIKEYKNLCDVGVNFGSEYVFEVHHLNGKSQLHYSPNEKFVPNLFSLDENPKIQNISALVGKNASGKSNLINS